MIDDKEIELAIKRIALTADGRFLHLGLQRALMALAPSPESGALQTFEGGRRFAAQLKRLMDESIAETTSDRSGDPATERPIVIAGPGAFRAGRAGGARRRVSAADSAASK